jgi:hypothetical protein
MVDALLKPARRVGNIISCRRLGTPVLTPEQDSRDDDRYQQQDCDGPPRLTSKDIEPPRPPLLRTANIHRKRQPD